VKNFILFFFGVFWSVAILSQESKKGIYHTGWIDFNKNGVMDIFEDPLQSIDKRVDNLISQMTMDEKTCQMVTLYGYGRVLKDELPTSSWKKELWKDGICNIDEQLSNTTFRPSTISKWSFPYSDHAKAINIIQNWFIEETRLGIPVDFTAEGIRGLAHDRATCFPASISIGSSWDKDLFYEIGKVIGKEAKCLGYTNVYAPILDVARDQRWGRIVECYGEDPFLVASLGTKMITGIQENNIASTVKHYAVYSAPKGGRDGEVRTDPHIALREMYNLYLYPFEKAFLEAGALGVMSSYNDYDGVPITGSYFFLTELLRKKYKFKGYITSDSDAVEFLFTKHHVASDYKDAVRICVEAGLNVRTTFTPPEVYVNPLRQLVKEGTIPETLINERVKDVLRVKMMLGLFNNPYVSMPLQADSIVRNNKHVQISKKASAESMVLLKNENNFLPLKKDKVRSILVTGPNASSIGHSLSRYGPNNVPIISVLKGLKDKLGNSVEIKYTKGCNIASDNWLDLELSYEPPAGNEKQMIDSAVNIAKKVDLAIVVLGEDETMAGESLSRSSLNLPGYQEDLLKAIHATGVPVVLVLINGRPLSINWADKNIPSILEAWFPGEFGGTAIADVLFGDYNPGGKLPVTFPKTVGQIPFNFPFKPASQAGQGNGKSYVLGPLYPFGYGLSYTTFEYSDMKITPDIQKTNKNISVECTVKNTGNYEGDEVVQLYIHDEVSSVTVYESQLRGFERVHLAPGEKKTINFILNPEDLSLLDKDMNRIVEPGIFQILIGSSSVDIRLKKYLTIISCDDCSNDFNH
jgi:beta-glucosidase